jgi:hypothetical protein
VTGLEEAFFVRETQVVCNKSNERKLSADSFARIERLTTLARIGQSMNVDRQRQDKKIEARSIETSELILWRPKGRERVRR